MRNTFGSFSSLVMATEFARNALLYDPENVSIQKALTILEAEAARSQAAFTEHWSHQLLLA